MPRNSERVRPRRADVREQVLAAAREVFADAGYHGAALDAIAARAGFSKGAVYSNFAGKDELFLALVEEELTARADQVAAATAELGTVGAAVLALATEGGLSNVVFAEFRAHAQRDPRLAARLGRLRDRLTADLADRLAGAVAQLGLTLTVAPAEAAAILLALVNGLSLEQIGRADPVVSADAVTAVLAGLVRDSGRSTASRRAPAARTAGGSPGRARS